MQVNTISNSIISTLGNPSSLVPLAVKDIINSSGVTYFSYDAGGALEGKDRFIDEFGTQIIWLFGLPVFKKLADKTFYKMKKLNPEVDIRVANSADHVDFAKNILSDKNADEAKNALSSINDAVKRLPEFKKLFYTKFSLATILTFASYYALTKYKQKVTEKAVINDFMAQKANEDFIAEKTKNSSVSKSFGEFKKLTFTGKKKSDKPSFKGLESFMFDPVKNLMIIDAGITSERLSKSRNKHEFEEYAIKEGSFLLFMYAIGGWIQKGIQKISQKFFKTPISLDLRFINSDKLKASMKTHEITKELEKASKLNTQKEVLDYILQNQKSVIVEGAKISNIIGKFKNGEINPQKYINTEDFKAYVKALKEFTEAAMAASDKSIGKFLKKAKIYKISAILANIGICCAALGYFMPKMMFEYRKKNTGSKDFHVANQVRARLEQTFSGK